MSLAACVDGATGSAPVVDEGPCSASLSCSRPSVTRKGSTAVDISGCVGACCTHSVPLRGCFVDMHGPEQFIYYLLIIVWLVTASILGSINVSERERLKGPHSHTHTHTHTHTGAPPCVHMCALSS